MSAMSLLDQRAQRMVSKELGLAWPAEHLSYSPFDDVRYTHRKKLNLEKKPWSEMTELPAEKLVTLNPFLPSPHREGGFAVWDSAALPHSLSQESLGCVMGRDPDPLLKDNLSYFSLVAHLGMVGATQAGTPVRPAGKGLFDLTRMGSFGWFLAESAHALAHLRCDEFHKSEMFRPIIQKAMQEALASLVHGILHQVPVYIGKNPTEGLAWPRTGFSVSNVYHPAAWVKKTGNGSLVPDETCVHCLYLCHVEPVPESYLAKTVKKCANDEWSGFPSIVAFAGWDGVDSIIHARNGIRQKTEYNVMHAADMLSPELFQEAVNLASETVPWPQNSSEWVNVKNWIGSDSWKALVKNTTPLPCVDCYMINQKTPGAPVHPHSSNPKAIALYEKNRRRCIEITEKAANVNEIACYHRAGMVRPKRDIRRRNNAKRRNSGDRSVSLAKRMKRIEDKMSGKIKSPLTEKQRELYEQMKKEHK